MPSNSGITLGWGEGREGLLPLGREGGGGLLPLGRGMGGGEVAASSESCCLLTLG